MNQNARAWLAALRSGGFTQTRQRLRSRNSYCCLGVACELYRRTTGEGRWLEPDGPRYPQFEAEGLTEWGGLPLPVADWLGLLHPIGAYAGGRRALSTDNDMGMTFAQIADVIEENQKELFGGR